MQFVEYLPSPSLYFLKDEAGASLMEHMLIGALVFVVCMLVLLALDKIAWALFLASSHNSPLVALL